MAITYDLTAKRVIALAKPAIRYSNALQHVLVRMTGTVPAADHWQAAVALNSKLDAAVVLTRTGRPPWRSRSG